MQTTHDNVVTINHREDWSGEARIAWQENGALVEISIPGNVALHLAKLIATHDVEARVMAAVEAALDNE